MKEVKIGILVILALFLTSTVYAAEYYVSQGQSVQAAINQASWGDTIYISGVHNEKVNVKSGITLDGRGEGVIDGNGMLPEGTHSGVINGWEVSDVTIRGLEVKNSNGQLINFLKSSHLLITDNVLHDAELNGVRAAVWDADVSVARQLRIEDVTITHNEVYRTNSRNVGESITVGNCDGFEIAYNSCHDLIKINIDALNSNSGTIHHNHCYNGGGPGIYLDGWAGSSHDIDIYNNYLYNHALSTSDWAAATGEEGHQKSAMMLDAEQGGSIYNVRIYDNVLGHNSELGGIMIGTDLNIPITNVEIFNNDIHQGLSQWYSGISMRIQPSLANGINIHDNRIADRVRFETNNDYPGVSLWGNTYGQPSVSWMPPDLSIYGPSSNGGSTPPPPEEEFMWGMNMPHLAPFAAGYYFGEYGQKNGVWVNGLPNWAIEYCSPKEYELEYWRNKGIKVIRLSVQWERLQHQLYGELDDEYLTHIDDTLDMARTKDLKVLIDLRGAADFTPAHPPGYYDVNKDTHGVLGSNEVPVSALADVWEKLAAHWNGRTEVWGYGLFNEPYGMPGGSTQWFDCSQLCINKIRSVDTETKIMIPGYSSSNTLWWVENGNDKLKNLVDPNTNLVYEGHMYMEYGQEDKSCDNVPVNEGVRRLTPFVNWLNNNNLKGVIGETGGPAQESCWMDRLEAEFDYITENQDVLVGCIYWMAAHRPENNYGSNIWQWAGEQNEPRYRPQVSVLEQYTSSTPPPPVFQPEDINQDGKINILDLIKVGQRMGQTGSQGWIREDINKDGKINILDMIRVAQHQ